MDVKVEFDVIEKDKGYQEAYLYFGSYAKSNLSAQGNKQNYETAGNSIGSGTQELTCNNKNVSALASRNWEFTLGWGANGSSSDTWYLGKTVVTFTFKP